MTAPDLAALRSIEARLAGATGPLNPETACQIDALGEGEFISYLGEACGDGGATEHEYEVAVTPSKYAIVYTPQRDLPDRSLNAAVALVERHRMLWSKSMEGFVCLSDQDAGTTTRVATSRYPNLAMTLVAGLVKALIARAEPAVPGRAAERARWRDDMSTLTLAEALAIVAELKPVNPVSAFGVATQRKAAAQTAYDEAEHALSVARAELSRAERELRAAHDALVTP